jgi:tRNA threonylcarbamoyladenosine biosynthesis protein TsaB
MLLLSIDTSGRSGSIALARGDANKACEVIEVMPLAGGTFSAQLVPQIAALLAKHGFIKDHIDAFAVASGPGSFTGLRVGLAAVKALAEILDKPIAAVSLLEAVAIGAARQGRVLAILDAGRGDVYAGDYEVSAESVEGRREWLIPREEFFAELQQSGTPNSGVPQWNLATSEKSLANAAQSANLPVVVVAPIDAGTIAGLGWRKIQAGQTVSPEQLEANYIRRTDAEIFAKNTG